MPIFTLVSDDSRENPSVAVGYEVSDPVNYLLFLFLQRNKGSHVVGDDAAHVVILTHVVVVVKVEVKVVVF